MEFLTFIGGIILLFFVLNLRGRVQKLERYMKDGITQHVGKPDYQPQPLEAPQSPTFDSLFNYIKQQLQQGVSKEEIKNSLMAHEWHASDIEKAFSMISLSGQVSRPVVAPIQTQRALSNRFVEWIKEDWMLKLGALLLLIGFGWLTTYAFLRAC